MKKRNHEREMKKTPFTFLEIATNFTYIGIAHVGVKVEAWARGSILGASTPISQKKFLRKT